ncbi:MAG: DUF3604 domain-containing protein [Pseudomonadota bacterium]|nr:DUF3604 domain-containing protein [Pseudomonadota bacterium]
MILRSISLTSLLLACSLAWAEPPSQAFFGDLHIHTTYSMDAFMAGNVRTTPDDAYRYAKGQAIPHPTGESIRLSGPPLDFLMVSDHASYLGVNAALLDPTSPSYGHAESEQMTQGRSLVETIRLLRRMGEQNHELVGKAVITDAWQKIIAAAERHNDPGRFTAFIGYEYTPSPGSRHLHRNVIFRDANPPRTPFSARDSDDPADLWDWLDTLRHEGVEALAIPHNMNQSDGLAFMTTTWQGDPIKRAFAEKRMRNEPIAEISQQKGTSETHPMLSPNDEWADFQIVQYYLNRAENKDPISVFKGGYYRDALLTGLTFKAEQHFNPYQLGAIGSSDSHVSAGAYEENQRFSSRSNDAVSRGSAYPNHADPKKNWQDFWTPRQATHGTGGLAGVWAKENTRAALYDAMRRRETFATSGPRIRVRLFASPDFSDNPFANADGHAQGVPMGGILPSSLDKGPELFVWAARDPHDSWLQRIQIVKGWVDDGKPYERIYDVSCADGLVPDPDTHRCPDNGASVNLKDCSISRDKGAVELSTTWRDPDFDPENQAFYYARVLQNPTCRWSTWDAIRLGISPNPDLPATHQERAWSSPIWFEPN